MGHLHHLHHHVLAFGPRNDLSRLAGAGVLPEVLANVHPDQIGWTDLQRHDWGLGSQPGLRSVVRRSLGFDMDKRLQTSDWTRRPLSQEQLDYAALDAGCLLLIHQQACLCKARAAAALAVAASTAKRAAAQAQAGKAIAAAWADDAVAQAAIWIAARAAPEAVAGEAAWPQTERK